MRAELVIQFRELYPDKPEASVRLYPALEIIRQAGAVSIDLCEDGAVLLGKQEFRKLAHIADDASIGSGRLVLPFAEGAPVYLVRE